MKQSLRMSHTGVFFPQDFTDPIDDGFPRKMSLLN